MQSSFIHLRVSSEFSISRGLLRINEIIENCYDKITLMDKKEEAIGILATGILHYLLTNALLSSQRKVNYQGMELDIVIPDIKTLEKDAKMTLLILIPKSSDKKIINEKISQLRKIQPTKDPRIVLNLNFRGIQIE